MFYVRLCNFVAVRKYSSYLLSPHGKFPVMKITNVIFKLFFFDFCVRKIQGWEFAHQFSEQIARFLRKNERSERFAHGLSFLVSDLNRSFLVSKLSNSLTSLNFGERPERFAHIAHKKEGISKLLIF